MSFALISAGMVTSVGHTAGSSCAAIRCRMSNAVASRFGDPAGGWLPAAVVPTVTTWGECRLLDLLVPAMEEALAPARDQSPSRIALILVAAAADAGEANGLVRAVEQRLGRRFHPASHVVAHGVCGGIDACTLAHQALTRHGAIGVVIAGVDSLVVPEAIRQGLAAGRLRTSAHRDGIVLGEAAAAVLCTMPGSTLTPGIICAGWHSEVCADSQREAVVHATVAAINGACRSAGISPDDLAGHYGNLRGREAVLALSWQRLFRRSHASFVSHAVEDSLGDIGAAWLPALAAVVFNADQRRWLAGEVVLIQVATAEAVGAAVFRTATSMPDANVTGDA